MQKLESYPDPTGKEKKRGASWKSRSTGSRAQSAWEYITDHSVQPALLQALLKLETPLLLVYTEPGLHTQSLSPMNCSRHSRLGLVGVVHHGWYSLFSCSGSNALFRPLDNDVIQHRR